MAVGTTLKPLRIGLLAALAVSVAVLAAPKAGVAGAVHVTKGATRTTNLLIFNDTFAGTSINVTWEVHADSPTGTLGASATLAVDVPLGSMATKAITMSAPASGTKCYLVLRAQKNGTTLFEETDESFTLQ